MNYQELLHSALVPSKIVPLVEKASQNDVPVLILGEQGTGRELIAKIIHHTGERKNLPFSKLDCKFLTEGSFREQLSTILREVDEEGDPGTVYLKEVGFLEEGNQLNLLRLLEDGIHQNRTERRILRAPRFISSSSEDLEGKVAQGKFAEDLYDRLNTLSVRVPSLRDRREEIEALARHVLTQHSQKMKIRSLAISKEALKLLESYWWPGNLREFERILIRGAIFSEGEQVTERGLLAEIGNERTSFASFLKRVEVKPPESPKQEASSETNGPPLPIFFIELVHRIKNPLVSIKTFTQLLREKFNDPEYREYFYRIVTEDIDKIDALLDRLLNYVKINSPLRKTNTVHSLLDEVFKKHGGWVQERRIKIYRKFEKDLPETVVHDEQLRYILSSIFQYAIPSVPPGGSIGCLTRSLLLTKEAGEKESLSAQNGRWIEIVFFFNGVRRTAEPFETTLGVDSFPQEEAIDLELRLVKEMIQKNRGTMRFEVNEKKARTLIFLRFPVERREVFYYPSTAG